MENILLNIKLFWLKLKITIIKPFVAINNFWDKLNYYALMYIVAPDLFNKKINKLIEYNNSK